MSILQYLKQVYSKNYFYLKNICFVAIQNGSKSNQVLQGWTDVCKFLRNANHVRFTECVMYVEKNGLVKKNTTL